MDSCFHDMIHSSKITSEIRVKKQDLKCSKPVSERCVYAQYASPGLRVGHQRCASCIYISTHINTAI